MKEKILLIDDELSLLQSVKRSLHKDYEIQTLQYPEQITEKIEQDGPFKVIISDMSMPEMTGDQVLSIVKEKNPLSIRILLTGNADVDSSIRAVNNGHIFKYLQKPCSTQELKTVITEALEYYELLASQYNHAISRQKELNIATKIQQNLLHSPAPNSESLKFKTFFKASKEVGGDFYEFIEQSPYCTDIIIGDVMGKGVPAALLGASLKSQIPKSMLVCSIKEGGIAPIQNILADINQKVCEQLINLESFVTLIYLRINSQENTVEYINCGHTDLLIKDADQNVHEIKGSNMPLGFLKDEVYLSQKAPFLEDDLLLSYTDGITEIPVGDELFGVERLMKIMQQNQEAENLIPEIIKACQAYQDFNNASDDLTMISVHYKKHPKLSLDGTLAGMEKLHSFLESKLGKEHPRYGEVATVASELYTNFCRYSFHNEQNPQVLLVLIKNKSKIELHFSHNGSFFEPETISQPDICEMKESGYGLFIVQEYCDEVKYTLEDNNWSTVNAQFKLDNET